MYSFRGLKLGPVALRKSGGGGAVPLIDLQYRVHCAEYLIGCTVQCLRTMSFNKRIGSELIRVCDSRGYLNTNHSICNLSLPILCVSVP